MAGSVISNLGSENSYSLRLYAHPKLWNLTIAKHTSLFSKHTSFMFFLFIFLKKITPFGKC